MQKTFEFDIQTNIDNLENINIILKVNDQKFYLSGNDLLKIKNKFDVSGGNENSTKFIPIPGETKEQILNNIIKIEKETDIEDEFSKFDDNNLILIATKLFKSVKLIRNDIDFNLRGVIKNNKIKTLELRKFVENKCRLFFNILYPQTSNEIVSNIKKDNINSETQQLNVIDYKIKEVEKILETTEISHKQEIIDLVKSKKCLYRFRKGEQRGTRCRKDLTDDSYFCSACSYLKPELSFQILPNRKVFFLEA